MSRVESELQTATSAKKSVRTHTHHSFGLHWIQWLLVFEMTQLLPQNARDKPTSAHPRIERSFMLTMASREDHNVYYRGTGGDDTSYSKAWLDTSVESNVDASHTSGGGRTTNHDASQILQCHHGSPSQPGVTAQNHTRQFVVHDYRDRALDAVHVGNRRFFGSANFPVKLHKVLDETHQMGWDHIISWASHGRCFKMHNTTAFVQDVMPKYDDFLGG
jgi:hypothetical protein